MKISIHGLLAGLSLLSIGMPGQAQDIHWSGFLSVVGGKIVGGDENSVYDAGFFGYDGGIYDDKFEFNQESIIGLQGQTVLDDRLRATVQIIGRGGERFDVSAEWAYLSYDLTKTLTLNVGKFRHPVYYFSDFLDVGYAYDWIRPPTQVYNGPSAMTGANLYYSKVLGDYYLTSQAWYGSADTVWSGLDFEVFNNQGINVTWGRDWWRLRGVYHTTDFNLNNPPGAPLGTVIESDLKYHALALIIEHDDLQFIAEHTDMKVPGADIQRWWYATIGYTFGNFTPHFTYNRNPNNPINTAAWAQTSTVLTYGLRWDFHPGVAFKTEYVAYDYEDEAQADFGHLSFAIDMLF